MKICKLCKVEKPLDKFMFNKRSGKEYSRCEECLRKIQKDYRDKNKERNRLWKKQHHYNNKERLNKISRDYLQNNKDKRREYLFNYRERRRILTKIRRQTDDLYHATECLRNGVTRAFASKGWGKTGKSEELLGADYQTVKKHIERQFKKGMSWDKRGEIHIDHIIPLSSAKTIEELRILCHYTNLQPLWKIENLRKNATIPEVQLKIAI